MAKRSSSPFHELPFPVNGLSVHSGFTHQDPGTCADARNVRGYDPTTNSLRGAQRCGHTKFVATQLNGSAPIQNLNHLVTVANATPSSGIGTRSLVGVGVAGGTVKTFDRTGFATPTNGSGALHATGIYIGSAVLLQKLFFADGQHWKYYNPATDTVSTIVPSAGSLPVDSAGNAPRLVMSWRGRLVYSGLIADPQNWFMSRQFDYTDWDYSPAITTATMPVAGNNTEAGLIPDVVNSMIAYSDDLALFMGDHSIFQFTEDPASGGQIDLVSDTVGSAFGDCWCRDALGNIYFMGSRGGLYALKPAQGGSAAPERISSQRIDERLLTIDFSENVVRMGWDDRFQTVMFYITPIAGGFTTNWAYDVRNQAFWPDEFANSGHNATAVHLMDGDDPDDRVFLVGGYDGYIRYIDVDAKSDDGTGIVSYAYMGPIQAESGKLRVRELRVTLGEDSDPCTLELFVGHSSETAFNTTSPRWAGSLDPGLNPALRPLVTAQAMYMVISNSLANHAWQWESAYANFQPLGLAAGRQL